MSYGNRWGSYAEAIRDIKCYECGGPALTVAPRRGSKFIGACGKHPEVVVAVMKATSNRHEAIREEKRNRFVGHEVRRSVIKPNSRNPRSF